MYRRISAFLKEDAFIKNNAIFFAGSMAVAFFNYLYHPVLSRFMSVEDFGEVQVIISFVFMTGVLLSVFRMVALNVITNSQRAEDDLARLYTLAIVIYLPISLLLGLFSPFVSGFFSFGDNWQSEWAFAPFALLLLVSVPATFYSSALQGTQRFSALSITNIIVSLGKLVAAVALVALGLRVFGAVSAILIAAFLSLLYSRAASSRSSKRLNLRLFRPREIVETFKRESSYGLLILIGLGFVTFLYSGDILIVKRLFPAEVAGLYGGVATIARIIFFATASVSGVLLSAVRRSDETNNRKALKKALLLVLGLGGAILLVFSVLPQFVVKLLIGPKYLGLAHLLPVLSIYTFLASLVNLLVSYLIALRSRSLHLISFVSIAVLSTLLFFNHSTPMDVVLAFMFGSCCALIILIYRIIFIKNND